MIALAIKDVLAVIELFKVEIKAQETALIKELHKMLPKFKDDVYQRYLHILIGTKGSIITAVPDDLAILEGRLKAELTPDELQLPEHIAFRDALEESFAYRKMRSTFYSEYFYHIGIKSCVYCNSQYALAVEKDDGGYRGKFQVDHYWAKSYYPAFSASLFNLYPACASCNNLKRDKKVNFKLYVDEPVYPSAYKFALEPGSAIDFLENRTLSSIDLEFTEPPVTGDIRTFNSTFEIKSIYNTQKDIVEELILKAEVYTTAYKRSLVEQFGEFFTEASIDRLLMGNYVDEKDIHKRPLAKFMQDISLDIGLIKRQPPEE